MELNLNLVFQLPVKPKRVMQLLTDTVLIRKWSGGEAKLELEPNGAFEMFDGWVTGKVIKVSENELSYTWKTTDWDDNAKDSIVSYKLTPFDGGTKVQVSHSGFPNEDEMKAHEAGWSDYFFDPLEDYIMVFDRP